MTQKRPMEILLVEDNIGDVILTRKAFQQGGLSCRLTVANTGEQALSMLKREGQYAAATRPDLILLDLNLPRIHGRDVLKELKESDTLRRIPVIVLSSSQAESDVIASYNLHANSYVVKPTSLDGFQQLRQAVEQFWFQATLLPGER